MILLEHFEPLLSGDVRGWRGLPPITTVDLATLFGAPLRSMTAELGYYPADRLDYDAGDTGELIAWARDGTVVMVQAAALPPVGVLKDLEQPCAVLPQEIRVSGAYAHEQLYCAIGLVLTVATSRIPNTADRVLRVRGIAPLDRPEQFGPQLYKALADQVSWSVP